LKIKPCTTEDTEDTEENIKKSYQLLPHKWEREARRVFFEFFGLLRVLCVLRGEKAFNLKP